MKYVLLTILLVTSSYAKDGKSTVDLKNKLTAKNVQIEKNPAEIIKEITATYEYGNNNRIKNSTNSVNIVFMNDQNRNEIKKIVYLIQSVYLSPLIKSRKNNIIGTLEIALYVRSKFYKSSMAICLAHLIPELKDKNTRLLCAKFATGAFGYVDHRCVKALCELLHSATDSLSHDTRLVIYRGLMNWATNEELLKCFKKEYTKNISSDLKYELAVQLAWLGDSSGAIELIKSLKRNKDNAFLRAVVRATLIKLYSVDLGDDTEAWEKLVEEKKK